MQLHILTIHDSKAEAFIQPFFAPTIAVGLRMVSQATNDPNSDFHKFSGDYTLFELGTFDSDSAKIELLDSPRNVAPLISLHSTDEPEAPAARHIMGAVN